MYLAAINKRYKNLVSNLAWSDYICFYAVEKSFDFTTEFPTTNQYMPLTLIDG